MKRDLELEATIIEKFVARSIRLGRREIESGVEHGVESVLDERSRRLWAAAESRAIGYEKGRCGCLSGDRTWRERLSDWVGAK